MEHSENILGTQKKSVKSTLEHSTARRYATEVARQLLRSRCLCIAPADMHKADQTARSAAVLSSSAHMACLPPLPTISFVMVGGVHGDMKISSSVVSMRSPTVWADEAGEVSHRRTQQWECICDAAAAIHCMCGLECEPGRSHQQLVACEPCKTSAVTKKSMSTTASDLHTQPRRHLQLTGGQRCTAHATGE